MAMDIAENVDVAPFAARVVRGAEEYSLWWEDPRDVVAIAVSFRQPVPLEELPQLQYWGRNWPAVHIPDGAVVGSGRGGWLPQDDWITGEWRAAAAVVEGSGLNWTYRFGPLSQEQLNEAPPFVQELVASVGMPRLDHSETRFRRTLKIRLAGPRAQDIEAVAVYSRSVWQEAEVALEWGGLASGSRRWDGRLEAYNGYILGVRTRHGDVMVEPDGSWRSSGSSIAGIVARVRYAACGSAADDTIITVRLREQESFSVAMKDLLAGEKVYLPHVGAAVGLAESFPGLERVRDEVSSSLQRTVYDNVAELPEQTWERVQREQPGKSRHIYFVLGCEGGRQKAKLHPDGSLEIPENFIRRVKGRDSERLRWQGESLHVRFGLPAEEELVGRELLEGYLPILRATWRGQPVAYEQEAFAAWLLRDIADGQEKEGDEAVLALVCLRLLNPSDRAVTGRLQVEVTHEGAPEGEELSLEGGFVYGSSSSGRWLRLFIDTRGRGTLRPLGRALAYEVALGPGECHSIICKVPLITLESQDEFAALESASYHDLRDKVASYWRKRVQQGMQITTPNEDLNRFHRAQLVHMLIVNDREPGSRRRVPRCGGFHYGLFPDEGIMCTSELDRRGYTEEAEQCLEMLLHYQGSVPLPGDFASHFGVLYGANGYECGGYNRGQGWAMWGLAEHYRYTRDRQWLERVAPALVAACDWVIQERQRTMRLNPDGSRPIDYGFLPAGSLEDVTDYWHWLSTNAYACWGFRAIAWALADIGHPEAQRLQAEAEAFYADLMQGFNEARSRSPVVKRRDGTWVPYYPPRLERRGRDFGWLREVLEGSMGLLVAEMIALDDPAAQWILDDYEDNLYLSREYGYPGTMPDFDASCWFDWGGFSQQSNLLLHPAVYLRRDDVKQFLRAFFNGFHSTFFRDVCMCCEHALPTLRDWVGDHFKTSDEANVCYYLRLMLIEERGESLILGKAIPRAWLEHGKGVKVERALTYFGTMSYELRSFVADGYIEAELELPRRNPPRQAVLRLRHPQQKPITRVTLNGGEWRAFSAADEAIYLPVDAHHVHLRACYD